MNKISLLKDLTIGYSNHIKSSNKYWSLLMFASIVSLFNYKSPSSKTLDLPFKLGMASQEDFQLFMLFLICSLSITFASTWLQQLRSRKIIGDLINDISKENETIHNVRLLDYFDTISSQNFNRVYPISQVFLKKVENKKTHKFFEISLYILLKTVTLIIIFLIPTFALIKGVKYFISHQHKLWEIPIFIFWLLIIISFIVFTILVISDLKYIIKGIRNSLNR